MITNKMILSLMLVFFIVSCNKERKKEEQPTVIKTENEVENVAESIHQSDSKLGYLKHTTDMKVEHFFDKGLITKNDFIEEFRSINWTKEVDEMTKTYTTNATRLEVLDSIKYLSISIGIGGNSKKAIKEFMVGIGDIDVESVSSKYFVELYGTKKLDEDQVIDFINLFFDKKSFELMEKVHELEYYVYVRDPHYIIDEN